MITVTSNSIILTAVAKYGDDEDQVRSKRVYLDTERWWGTTPWLISDEL
ncbi:hypothetical protein [Photobacterium sp. OFAV2-7]|nr:hypothetical protein [Photobacterium sp. OFAV2-7]MCG7584575.1 hypothetical protein [Photobacterium sp. OFAV2-7]